MPKKAETLVFNNYDPYHPITVHLLARRSICLKPYNNLPKYLSSHNYANIIFFWSHDLFIMVRLQLRQDKLTDNLCCPYSISHTPDPCYHKQYGSVITGGLPNQHPYQQAQVDGAR